MVNKLWKVCLSLTAVCCIAGQQMSAAAPDYESYLESWNSNYSDVVSGITSYEGMTLTLAFSAYDFDVTPPTPIGLQFSGGVDAAIASIVNTVHNTGGKVKVSFGGAFNTASPGAPNYLLSQMTAYGGFPSNISTLATKIANMVQHYSLDGVDFDIEDANSSVPSGFATNIITFLKAVRTALDGLSAGHKIISIAIPAQGWGTYWKDLAIGAASSGAIDYINFMEYDIWAGVSYPLEQIKADLVTYTSPLGSSQPPNNSPGWGIAPQFVHLGLMTGNDDGGQFLSVADAASGTNNDGLTAYAVQQGFYGVMTWDLTRDATDAYQYTTEIRAALTQPAASNTALSAMYPATVRQLTLRPFVQQAIPPHGAP